MKKILVLTLLLVFLVTGTLFSQNPTVTMKTSMGTIQIELYADKAPISTENFLAYVDAGFYAGSIFHRVIPDFMVQGGGFDAAMNKIDVRDPIQNEAKNGVENLRGTLAMARTNDPHSATAQFFINHKDNPFLDQQRAGPGNWGYAVFGMVTEGMEVVDAIAAVATTQKAGGHANVPVEPVVIEEAKRN